MDELLGVEREARAERARWEARRDALEQLLAPEDGTSELLGKPGVLGQVAPLLRVAPGYEDAVAAALAPFADAVVVDSLARGMGELDAARAAGRSLRLVVAPGDQGRAEETLRTGRPRPRRLLLLPPVLSVLRSYPRVPRGYARSSPARAVLRRWRHCWMGSSRAPLSVRLRCSP